MQTLQRIVVLTSGQGTNLQALIDAQKSGAILGAKIVHVFSNRPGSGGIERATKAGIPTTTLKWNKNSEPRKFYDQRLSALVRKQRPDLIVLAGWMHILSQDFLKDFDRGRVINLHPALPGQFPGANAIQDALDSLTDQTGVMAHEVVPEVDAGKPLVVLPVPIMPDDTFETLRARIQTVEKSVLILAVVQQLQRLPPVFPFAADFELEEPNLLQKGKVRDVYRIGYGTLMMAATDRFSCFDHVVCNVPQKGNVLNQISAWWFEQTRHIVPNHMISSRLDAPISFVRECTVFPIEFVVRGYITGTTNTAMWTLYEKGQRVFDGETLPDGMWKNEELPHPMLTPTTKSADHDMPITSAKILDFRIMTVEQLSECTRIALELFEFGQYIANKRGLILVDTKYEFGLNHQTGEITLVDEIHTCDSSRYWEASTYRDRFDKQLEPERFDKDIIRYWIRERCDPYHLDGADLPVVPPELIETTSRRYISFYERLLQSNYVQGFPINQVMMAAAIDEYFTTAHYPRVVLVVTSNDSSESQEAASLLEDQLRLREIYTQVETIDQETQFNQAVLHVVSDEAASLVVTQHPAISMPLSSLSPETIAGIAAKFTAFP